MTTVMGTTMATVAAMTVSDEESPVVWVGGRGKLMYSYYNEALAVWTLCVLTDRGRIKKQGLTG